MTDYFNASNVRTVQENFVLLLKRNK